MPEDLTDDVQYQTHSDDDKHDEAEDTWDDYDLDELAKVEALAIPTDRSKVEKEEDTVKDEEDTVKDEDGTVKDEDDTVKGEDYTVKIEADESFPLDSPSPALSAALCEEAYDVLNALKEEEEDDDDYDLGQDDMYPVIKLDDE